MESMDSREDQKKSLIDLNNRLVSYVEKVRKLQEAADVIDSIPRTAETSESTLKSIKLQYGAEIDGWRAKYEEAQSLLAQLQNNLGNLKTENRQLSFKLSGLDGGEGDFIILQGDKRQVPFRIRRDQKIIGDIWLRHFWKRNWLD